MSQKNITQNPDKRTKIILKSLIEKYIQSGEPVGSKTLAEETGLSVSPATVRHILADLEAQGYLHSPHTSAGRIPTARGYRLFVDSLLIAQPLSALDCQKAKKILAPALSTPDLLSKASLLISSFTSLASIVTVPKQKNILLSHLEFLPLSDNRVLAVLVLNNREIQNRILYTARVYTAGELQEASNYLNAHFKDKPLASLKKALKEKMQADKKELDHLLQAAINTPEPREDFVLSGQMHLLNSADFSQRNPLREIFEAFNRKRDILHLLDQCIQAPGLQIYIGEESGYAPLDDYSLISAPYTIDDKIVGVLAVIGPTRMSYERVIPAVDITAKLLGAALNQVK